jgi:hypothetical protein
MSVATIRRCDQALSPKLPEFDLSLSRGLTRKATGPHFHIRNHLVQSLDYHFRANWHGIAWQSLGHKHA